MYLISCPAEERTEGDQWRGCDVRCHHDGYTEARKHLKTLLDAVESGRMATVRRDSAMSAIVDGVRSRHFLAEVSPSRDGWSRKREWSIFIPGPPVATDGASLDEAVKDHHPATRFIGQPEAGGAESSTLATRPG
jgi:hypothetical protein